MVIGRLPAFSLRLGGGGAFPSARRGRVVWIGAVEGDAEVRGSGRKPSRPPWPAGLRGGQWGRLPQPCDRRPDAGSGDVSPAWRPSGTGRWGRLSTVEEIVLYESRLSPREPPTAPSPGYRSPAMLDPTGVRSSLSDNRGIPRLSSVSHPPGYAAPGDFPPCDLRNDPGGGSGARQGPRDGARPDREAVRQGVNHEAGRERPHAGGDDFHGGPALDVALGVAPAPGPDRGDLRSGVLGKSTLAMHVVAEAQRNGGACAYIDAEHHGSGLRQGDRG